MLLPYPSLPSDLRDGTDLSLEFALLRKYILPLSYPLPRGVLVSLACFLGSHTVFICGVVSMFVGTRFPCGITICVPSLLLFPSTDGSTPKLQVEVVEVLLPLRISLALEQLRWRQYW